jgi:hypothetical protein
MSTIFRCCQENVVNTTELSEGLIEIRRDINTLGNVDHLEYKFDRGYPLFDDKGKMEIELVIYYHSFS